MKGLLFPILLIELQTISHAMEIDGTTIHRVVRQMQLIYTFGKIIAQGSYGIIIEVKDNYESNLSLVCKISCEIESYRTEVEIMKRLKNKAGYIQIIKHGEVGKN